MRLSWVTSNTSVDLHRLDADERLAVDAADRRTRRIDRLDSRPVASAIQNDAGQSSTKLTELP